jgi:RES domain-containing protein
LTHAWRLCREPFADLSGDGARRYGGRWNSPGRALVYASDTAALAVLEVRVHLDIPPDLVPDDYVLLTIDLGRIPVETLSTAPPGPGRFGDSWLREQRTPVLRVPSFIVAESTNLLLNPAHPLAGSACIVGKRRFAFDRRLWLPL